MNPKYQTNNFVGCSKCISAKIREPFLFGRGAGREIKSSKTRELTIIFASVYLCISLRRLTSYLLQYTVHYRYLGSKLKTRSISVSFELSTLFSRWDEGRVSENNFLCFEYRYKNMNCGINVLRVQF